MQYGALPNITYTNMDVRAQHVMEFSIYFRCFAIIPVSILIVIFSFNKNFKNDPNLRFWLMNGLFILLGIVVALTNGYRYVFWRSASRFVHQQKDNLRVPGRGDLLFYITFVFGYSGLQSFNLFLLALMTCLIWMLQIGLQLDNPATKWQHDNQSISFTIFFEGGQIFFLMMMVWYQTYRREQYTRLDFLQQMLLEAQRNALIKNQKLGNQLLTSMLPPQIIEKLKNHENVMAEMYNPVTVMFIEVCEFSKICQMVTPLQTIQILNEVYTVFDHLTDVHSVYKVETVGEVYMAVAGCPVRVKKYVQKIDKNDNLVISKLKSSDILTIFYFFLCL